MFRKDPTGTSEVVNDVHKDLCNFWRILQGTESFAQFQRLCQATPFSQVEWDDARAEFDEYPEPDDDVSDAVVRAWQFFVLCRQSLGGAMKSFAPTTQARLRKGMNEQASAWLSAVDGLPEAHARLKSVVIKCGEATDVMLQEDSSETLHYLDPPYRHSTRAAKSVYEHEMADGQHEKLLEVCSKLKGRFILSGYRSDLYDDYAAANDWKREDVKKPNAMGHGKKKREMVESLWLNF